MRSEKLKQLVKDKVSLKFRIKDAQQSKELQEFFFNLGVGWTDEDRSICRTYDKYIYFSGNFFDTDSTNDENYFNNKLNEEFDLENDCLVEECKWPNLKKLVEAKTPLKFRIKDAQQFKEFQDFMFALDAFWYFSFKNIQEFDSDYQYLGIENSARSSNIIIFSLGDSESSFNQRKTKEFDLENDCLIEPCKWPTTLDDLISHVDGMFKELRERIITLEDFKKSIKENL